jgi:hypothetical protein
VREENDRDTVLTERRQWRTAAARAGTRAHEGRRGLAYKRAGRSVGVGRNVLVPLGGVERPRAWPATCAAPAANGTPWALAHRGRCADCGSAPPGPATCYGRQHGCSPALRSDQRSHRRLGVRAQRVRRVR